MGQSPRQPAESIQRGKMAGRSKGLSASEDSPRLTHRRLRQIANEVNVLCWDPMLLITETLGERSGDAGTQAGDRDRTGVHAGTLDLWLPTPPAQLPDPSSFPPANRTPTLSLADRPANLASHWLADNSGSRTFGGLPVPAWPARCIQDFSAGSCSDRGSCRDSLWVQQEVRAAAAI